MILFQARNYWILIVVAALSGCADPGPSPNVTELDVTLETEFEIGADTGDEMLPLFEDVRSIVTDARGHIFVFEYRRGQFHEYTSGGSFIATYGAQGRGPGEFQVMTHTDVTEEGHILIFDHHGRRLTYFDPMSAEFESTDFPSGSVGELIDVGGDVVAFEFNPADPASVDEPVFSVYERDENEPAARFGSYETFAPDSALAVRFMYSGGHMIEWTGGDLLFTPRVHDGRLFRYSQTGNAWSFRETVNGMEVDPPYELLNDPEDERADFKLYGSGGISAADVAEYSQGLYRLADGRLVHMVQRQDDDGLYVGVDVFDAKLQFVGTGRIDTQVEGTDAPQILHATPLWLDRHDRLYLRRVRPTPSVVVARITIAETVAVN